MGIGRFFCVALPFALTIGSIIFLLVGNLAGVVDKSLYAFRIDVEDLSIDPANVDNLVENLDLPTKRDLEIRAPKTENITAENLGLSKYYDISIWSYCHTDQQGKRHCTKPKFNWADTALDPETVEEFGSAAGVDIDLPKEIEDALNAFSTVSKWTQVAFIAAFVALALELLMGIFANCSRIFSCITWILAGVAALLVCVAASLATAMSVVVVGAVEASAKFYGARGRLNTRFLAAIWIAAAFAIGAAFFWLFTVCCCKPEHRSRKSRKGDGEKNLPSGAYAPLGGSEHEMTTGYYNQNQSQSQYGAPRYPSGAARSDLAYEPYSHRA